MAYSVDWVSRIVTIPTSDLILVSGTHYSINMAILLAEVRRLEWEFSDGLWAAAILDHTNTKFDFAGANYAPFDEFINNYLVQFTGVATRIDILGANNNIADVLIPTGISIVTFNSAGLIVSDSGLSDQEKSDVAKAVWDEVL